MSTPKLTPTSYLVLGLAAYRGPVTPYEMKSEVNVSIGNFWSFPHSQLYAEPKRLAALGLLHAEQEEGGRRKCSYTITEAGREALAQWFQEPTPELTEIRNLALLKLYFGGLADPEDIGSIARDQIQSHSERLEVYRELEQKFKEDPDHVPKHLDITLGLGLRYEQVLLEFWKEVASDS